jgi:hypothetical protein
MHTVSTKDGYLLIEVRGDFDKDDVFNVLSDVVARPEHRELNDIWLVRDCLVVMLPEDFIEIVKRCIGIMPEDVSKTKSAIVIGTESERFVSEMWVQYISHLPYETRVFTSLDEAEAWVKTA